MLRCYALLLPLQAMASSSSSASSPSSPADLCDVDLRFYSSSSDCVTGFSTKYSEEHSIVADGVCRNSPNLGYYVATCDGDTNRFTLARSGCADETCSDCSDDADAVLSGTYQEGGCMVDWTVSDIELAGSIPFAAIANGGCQDSGIPGLGHYVSTCRDGGDWMVLSRGGCADGACDECTRVSSEPIEVASPLRSKHLRQCNVDAYYRERVWSVSGGTCKRSGCSGSIALPEKWWSISSLGKSLECIYGSDYPEHYYSNTKLRESVLFDSEEECCDAYARVGACIKSTSSQSVVPDTVVNDVTLVNDASSPKVRGHTPSSSSGVPSSTLALFGVAWIMST